MAAAQAAEQVEVIIGADAVEESTVVVLATSPEGQAVAVEDLAGVAVERVGREAEVEAVSEVEAAVEAVVPSAGLVRLIAVLATSRAAEVAVVSAAVFLSIMGR